MITILVQDFIRILLVILQHTIHLLALALTTNLMTHLPETLLVYNVQAFQQLKHFRITVLKEVVLKTILVRISKTILVIQVLQATE